MNSHSEQLKAAIEHVGKSRRDENLPLQAMEQRMIIRQEAVNDIMALWQQRQRLQDDLQAEIDDRRTRLQTKLYEMENSGNTSAKLNLEAQISNLFRESMQHRLDLFRDKLALTRELHSEEERLLALWPLYKLRN
jgi:hypothetical protein